MKLKNIIRMAFENLMSNRSRTIVTIIGIIIGIGAIVFLVSLGYSLQDLVKKQVANMDELYNIDVTLGGSSILKITDDSVAKIKELPNVDSVYPVISTGAKIHYNKTTTDGIAFATNTDYLNRFKIKPELGQNFTNDDAKEMMINQSALDLIGIKDAKSSIGKNVKIDLIVAKNLLNNDEQKTITDLEYKIVGIYNLEDTPYVYLPQKTLLAQKITNYSSLKVRVVNKNKIIETRKAIENIGFKTEYVGDTISQINSVFRIFKITLASFGLIATMVAALGMFNTLTVSLLERIREIGLMKALGAKKKDIYLLFITESLIMGIAGGIFGLVLGHGIGLLLSSVLNIIALSVGGTPVEFFHTPILFAVLILGFSLLVGFITGIYPAKRAVKIDPLDALKYE